MIPQATFVQANCRVMRNEDRKSGPTQSFVTGVIAVVFLLVGYQTAVFVHRAAVMKIVADRDEPDTVYVYMQPEYEQDKTTPLKSERKNCSHEPRANVVRQNVPLPRVENFPFNPNTATVEELCRLGFSLKQAQSIENYRTKGGKFRRKSDFAKSFVVSDSIYKRLESYIDIPLLDLNQADSADFDALPGIGGWFASKMVEYRKSLGGYSYKEQLMEIYRFDQEKYEALCDLVTISDPYNYPIWKLPADSLQKHPYIRNYETANAIVLFRQNSPPEARTVDNLASSGIISRSTADRLSRCVSK